MTGGTHTSWQLEGLCLCLPFPCVLGEWEGAFPYPVRSCLSTVSSFHGWILLEIATLRNMSSCSYPGLFAICQLHVSWPREFCRKRIHYAERAPGPAGL
ncbi:hypothetical protein B0T22DRAFT_223132 [Podospora appendiculata]|uniref:Secreted protein n=1 Tax=Podospora appendiculata TaxID=314037 RepID=A0AAE0X5J5_9PEZI|nr:hypothetical protein B0T22DRAFT_223132 [Podospora appendiculata]